VEEIPLEDESFVMSIDVDCDDIESGTVLSSIVVRGFTVLLLPSSFSVASWLA